jgi:hypothetical protein
LAFYFAKPRHSSFDAEPFGISRVNGADKRLNEAFENLASEAAPNKARYRFILMVALARQKKPHGEAKLPGHAKQRRRQYCLNLAGTRHQKTGRNRLETAAVQDRRLMLGPLGTNQRVFKSYASGKIQSRRRMGEKIVGRRFHEKAVAASSFQNSA